jgi:drug/metabolite transporter (DMT)-like permease
MLSHLKWSASQRRAVCWVIPCIAAWSLIPRLAAGTGTLTPHQYLFWSSLVSTACLLVCTRLTGHWSSLRSYSATDFRRLTALAALGAFGYYALLYIAYAPCSGLQECPEKDPIIIIGQYTWPAASVLWSSILLRERLTGRMILALFLSVIAIALSARAHPPSADALVKLPVVLLAALIFGLYSTLLKRVHYEPFSSLAVGFAAAMLMSAVTAIALSGTVAVPDTKTELVGIAVNGVFVNGLSYVWWYRALKAAPLTFVAPWISLTPLIAAIVGMGVFEFQIEHWAGVSLVLLSILLATTSGTECAASRRGAVSQHRFAEESV